MIMAPALHTYLRGTAPAAGCRKKSLLASDGAAYDYFGNSVSVYNNTAVIGALFYDGKSVDSGGAYIFERDSTGSWIQTAQLNATNGATYDFFGNSVSVYNNTAVIGAPFYDGTNGVDSGTAYIFERDSTGSWIQTEQLNATDATANDRFGLSVSVYNNTAVIGAPFYDGIKSADSGAAYVFEKNSTGSWTQTKLPATNAVDDNFGRSVSVYDNTAVIGAPNHASNGTAYIFERNTYGTWEQTKLLATDAASLDNFGYSVSVYNGTALIGAPDDNLGDDPNTIGKIDVKNSGSAYLFANIVDTIAPVITLKGGDEYYIPLNKEGEYIDPGYMTDDGSKVATNSDEVKVDKIKSYLVSYDSTDPSKNNATTVFRTVHVVHPDREPTDLLLTPAGNATDCNGDGCNDAGTYPILEKPSGVDTFKIDNSTYAIVTSNGDDNNESEPDGIQIINVTNPYYLKPAGNATDCEGDCGVGTYPTLKNPSDVAIFYIDSNPYAIVASNGNDGIQIINMTDPYSLKPEGNLIDTGSTNLDNLVGVATFTINYNPYAIVTSGDEGGSFQIINVANPEIPSPAGSGTNSNYSALVEPYKIDTFNMTDSNDITSTYAIVASPGDNGIQMINMTDPDNPLPAGGTADGDWYPSLTSASDVKTFTINGDKYAIAITYSYSNTGSNYIQIIKINVPLSQNLDSNINPVNPVISSVRLDNDTYPELMRASTVDTFNIDNSTYAIATSRVNDSIQIINMTDPYSLKPAGEATDCKDDCGDGTYPVLDYPSDVAIFYIDNNPYAIVTSRDDNGIQTIEIGNLSKPPPPPKADAGDDQIVGNGTAVTLDGSGSSGDSDIVNQLKYLWKQVLGNVMLSNPDMVNAAFTAPQVDSDQILTFALVVNDTKGVLSTADYVDITVRPNSSPTANAGDDQTVGEGTKKVTLDGTGSTDPDGYTLTYAWSQTQGPTVTLSSSTLVSPTFDAPQVDSEQTLTFSLVVTDELGADSTNNATVDITIQNTINKSPKANAGDDQTVGEGTKKVTLDGTGSTDPNGDTLTYAWSQTQGPTVTLSSSTSVSPTFDAPQVDSEQTLTFSLVVTDELGADSTNNATVDITIQNTINKSPKANAGDDQTVGEGTKKVTLDGTGSTDDKGSENLRYEWRQDSTDSIQVTLLPETDNPAIVTFDAPADVNGSQILTFILKVIDKEDLSNDVRVTVTILDTDGSGVTNQAPTANAGDDQTVGEGTKKVTLDGTGSTDPNGDTLTYAWSQTQGPTVTLSSSTSVSPTFDAPQVDSEQTLTFSLVVTDELGADSANNATVTVTILDTDAVTPSPGGGSSGGGGGGGGGGGSGGGPIRIDNVYIKSVSWDCNAGTIKIIAGPDSDYLSISVRTTQLGVHQASVAGDDIPGYRAFVSNMDKTEDYIGIKAVAPHSRDPAIISESINITECTGERTFDEYMQPESTLPSAVTQTEEEREATQRTEDTPVTEGQETIFDSPLYQQLKGDIPAEMVQCNEGLVLVLKPNMEESACVKESTAHKLVMRGWHGMS